MIIEFKSNPKNYAVEKCGRKSNTFRKVDITDKRFITLDYASTHPFNQYLKIKIINTETKESFTRNVSDITYWDGYVIISWFHKSE